jgi:hypothetical protein
VPERQHAAVAEHEVEAGGGQGVDHHPARKAHVEEKPESLHRQREGGEQQHRDEDADHPRAGNRPCGRK